MSRLRREIWVGVIVAAVCLGLWLNARPLLTGVFGEGDRLQLISAAYMLLAYGMMGAVLLVAAVLTGLAALAALRLEEADSWRRGWLALGLGVLYQCMLTLGLGLLGWLEREVFGAGLAVPAAAGIAVLLREERRRRKEARESAPKESGEAEAEAGRRQWWVLLMLPLATLGLMAAMVPAGVLWGHDGKGYDVLEYHLQLPREYWERGAIEPIEHNIFAHLPGNAEMLYLEAMVLTDSKMGGMYLGKLLNYAWAVLLVAGVYVFLRDQSRLAAGAAAIAVAGPQLFFVATNAYVEALMLLMFLLALGALGLGGESDETRPGWRRLVLAGIFVGGACGCKYTGLVMMAPIVIAWAAGRGRGAGERLRNAAMVGVVSLVMLAPWLMKNAAYTGNPVFPLAHRVLGAGDYDAELLARWDRATAPRGGEGRWPVRLRTLGRELLTPKHYGALTVLCVAALLLGRGKKRGREAWLWLGAVAFQVLFWLLATHLQSRFLLPVTICAPVLAVAAIREGRRNGKVVLAVLMVATAVGHVAIAAAAYQRSTRVLVNDEGFHPWVGGEAYIAAVYPFGEGPPEDAGEACVLLVGEARPFYVSADYRYNTVFDRCRLAEAIRTGGVEEGWAWLRREGIDYVYVNWSEVDRLRRSYGFDAEINRQTMGRLAEIGLRALPDEQNGRTVLYEVMD